MRECKVRRHCDDAGTSQKENFPGTHHETDAPYAEKCIRKEQQGSDESRHISPDNGCLRNVHKKMNGKRQEQC